MVIMEKNQFVNETLDSHRAKVDKLFQVTRDKAGAATGYTQPLFLTAPEILATHHLVDSTGSIGDQHGSEKHMDVSNQELDWKLHRASRPTSEQVGKPMGGMGGLRDDIKEHGFDWSHPVETHVEQINRVTPYGPGIPGGKQSPSDVVPVLNDGHHRIAVMAVDRPHDFIPVTQNRNLGQQF